ncbi:MAG: hypothetical protein HPY64_05605 [Anaerolineae bacterium]|nr:hypothetical protein [Anaerolineae bacterium]
MSTVAKISVVLALLSAFIMALPALAQGEATPIAYGEAVRGEITAQTAEVFYTFSGKQGDTITITMTAFQQGLDSFLELTLPDGTLVSDDDSAGNLNSLIGPLTLPVDGQYRLRATRFGGAEGGSTGAFEIVIRPATTLPLTPNETVTVTLGPDQPFAFLTMTAQAGTVYALTGQGLGGTTSFSISVRDSLGSYVNQAYSPAEGLALIDPLLVAADGGYNVTVFRQQDGPQFDPASTVRVALTLRIPETQSIAVGQTVSGTLDSGNPIAHYVFEGQLGDLLRLEGRHEAGTQPIDVQVVNPAGYISTGMGTAYGPEEGRFVLDPFILEMDGRFVIAVRQTATGPDPITTPSVFSLTLAETQTPLLAVGQAVTGTVDQAIAYEKVFRFEGTAGQRVNIVLESVDETYVPALDVQGPPVPAPAFSGPNMGGGGGVGMGFILSMNGAVPGKVQYTLALPADGLYVFRVRLGSPYALPPMSGPEAQTEPLSGTFSLRVDPAS